MSSESQEEIQDDAYEVSLDEAVSLARGHHLSGNYILAERTYRDILHAVPDHFPTVSYLGVLLYQTGNFEDAIHYMEKALEVEPEDVGCLTNYGGILVADGRYEKALEILDRALGLKDDAWDIYNNKSYVYKELDDFETAKEMAKKALSLSPGNVDALVNLGVAQACLEEYEEALGTWEEAEMLSPEHPVVLSNLGNTLKSLNRLLEAEEKCKKALEIDDSNLDAMLNLGNISRDLGNWDYAIELYEKATDANPKFHLAHYNKALAYFDKEMFSQAMVAARYAVAFEEEDYKYYSILSAASSACNELDRAHFAASRAIKLSPDKAEPYLDMVDVLVKFDRYDDALATMEVALKHETDTPRVCMKLANVYIKLEDYDKALEAVDKGLETQPEMAALSILKSNICVQMQDPEPALAALDKVLEMNPRLVMVLINKAEIYININENEKAKEIIEQVKTHTTKLAGIYGVLTSIKKMDEQDEDFILMKEVYDEVCEKGSEQRMAMNFAMYKAYDGIKDYDKAFEYLKLGADARRETIPPAFIHTTSSYERVKNTFTPARLKEYEGAGYQDSERAVFIIGMPRSGTTLTEQIISSHPLVHGAGELSAIGKAMKLQAEISKDTLCDIGKTYIEEIKDICPDENIIRVTDKMPANFLNLGLIVSALPNAKIIHCRRNPIDTCLSCYKQNFANGQYWSYDQEDLADEYLRYLDLMEYWREALPGRFLEINYEDTVTNTEEQARKLIDYIGLEWDEACLEPHKQKRVVLTASRAQVTQPVYTSSVKGWKRYEKHLQPLVRRLMPEEAMDA